jgi:23S rRNA (cytidine1920-2'-O)/16S rRNA (cytidine1409-2'-O)-methyltransferase
MKRLRLDQTLVARGLVKTRSQAENYIKLGYVRVAGKLQTKPGHPVDGEKITLSITEQYVSRAALKLASVADKLKLDFRKKVVLDVGSSTGGFTDFALRHGALKVIAVDVGANQMHPKLRADKRIELHEKTDIRDVNSLSSKPDIVLIDVSFISLRDVLPHIKTLCKPSSLIVAMCKPQFEAGEEQVHRGVIKNDALRRKILKDFEAWAKKSFNVTTKADSEIAGAKGNLERFYLLFKL